MELLFHFKKVQGKGNIVKPSQSKTRANVIIATTLNIDVKVVLPDKINRRWKQLLAEAFDKHKCVGGGFFYGTKIIDGEKMPCYNDISAIEPYDFAKKAANIILAHNAESKHKF